MLAPYARTVSFLHSRAVTFTHTRAQRITSPTANKWCSDSILLRLLGLSGPDGLRRPGSRPPGLVRLGHLGRRELRVKIFAVGICTRDLLLDIPDEVFAVDGIWSHNLLLTLTWSSRVLEFANLYIKVLRIWIWFLDSHGGLPPTPSPTTGVSQSLGLQASPLARQIIPIIINYTYNYNYTKLQYI